MDSSVPEEEDWESAGLNMENFKLAEPIIPKNKPAFIMPARLLSRPIIGDINFLHEYPPVMSQASSSTGANSSGSQFAPSAAADSTDIVDSALISAIENPRERMQVLNLENVLLLFVKSSERSMELPPEHNSFRRLLAYRIAQRFGLTHAVSDQLNENGERGILIYRTTETRIPSPLLIDLPPPNDCPSDQSPFGSNQNLQEAGIEAPAPVAKKMTMMKRNPNRDNDVKKESQKKEKQTAEEREKAYAEARARIFGAEAEAAATSAALSATSGSSSLKKSSSDSKIEKTAGAVSPRPGSASPSPPLGTGPTTANTAATSNTKKKATPAAGKKSPGPDSAASVPVTTSKPTPKDQVRSAATVSPPPVEVETVKVKKKTVDVTAWKEKKFTVRDQDAERSDPDFSRRNVPSNNSSRGPPQHGQYSQQSQFRGPPDDQISGYQNVQIQGPGMSAPAGQGYQQGYQAPQDPYQYGQNGNGMMPFGPPGGHNPYIQGPFGMQMGHMNMGAAPTSPPQQQQWQQARPQGVMINQHQGNPYYPHLPSGVNMAAIHPPLGQMPLGMNMGIYSPIQGQGHGPIPGGYGNGPYGPLGNLYPPLPSTTNISNNTYNSLSTEQHQNPPSV